MKQYIVVFFAACVVTTASAQTTGGFNDWVTSLAIDPSGRLYAGTSTNGNGIFISTDGGTTWQHTKMRYGVASMTMTKSGTVIAYGLGYSNGRYLFRLTGGGSQLDSVSLAFTPTSFAVSEKGTLYASTFTQGLYTSADDGMHWTAIASQVSSANMMSPVAVTKDEVLIVPTKFGVYRVWNNGANWDRARFINHDTLTVKQIITSHDGTLFAGAYEGMRVDANEVFVSSNSGSTWNLIKALNFTLDVMAIDSVNTMYAGNSDGVYRITAKGDTSYRGLGGIAVSGTGVRSLLALSKDTVYAGAWGGVYKTVNGGTSWRLLHDGMAADAESGDFTSALPFGGTISSGVVTKNGSIIVGTDSAGVFRSFDRGKTWMQTTLTAPSITSVVTDWLGTVWVSSLDNGMFTSTDNGASWTPVELRGRKIYALAPFISNVPGGGFDSTAMDIQHFILTGNDWGVYAYHTDASVGFWIPGGTPSIAFNAITRLSADAVASTPGGDVYRSPGGWKEWKYQGRTGGQAAALVTNGAGMLFAVGPSGVFRSTDKGVSWNKKNLGIFDTTLVSAVVDKAGNIFVGSSRSGDIYKSVDQGEHWTTYATLSYPVRCILLDPQGGIIYAAFAGRLFMSVTVPTSVQRVPIASPNEFALSQNYPNPFNPSTVINYTLPVNAHVSVAIYDLLGREVALLVNEYRTAGNHSVTFDAGMLPSGVYLYRLRAAGFTETKRLLLVK